jgi:hypothetical protein
MNRVSSHSYKFGNVIGEILSDLIEEKKPKFDISLFSLNRLLNNNLIKGPSMLKKISKETNLESKL